MTPTQRSPYLFVFPLAIILCFAVSASASKKKPAAASKKSAKAAKSAKAEKGGRAARGRQQAASKKSSRKETRAERRARERDERASRGKRGRNEVVSAKGRKLSKRERLAQARREAEERRRRAEAARRAEIARQQAIARQRALDQALRDEVQQNILRDDTTGEDPEVRRVAVQALGYHAGTVVVMNPKTGQIYTVVNQAWGVRRGFKPCSTIKLVSGLAGLVEGVIDPVAENVNYTNRMNLTDALAFSHNGYFQQVGRKVGFERMSSYARQLGLGERTGVNHVGEFPGRLPLFKNDVGMLRMSSHGDDIEVTPLQLAALASVFATGGTLVTPHLPRTPEENVKFKTEVRRQLNIPQEHLRRMLPGMIGAVNYGSGKKSYDPTQTIAGKTGTCIDTDRTAWVGLFTSYAPVEDPQLAIAVIGRGSDARNHFPAAVAGQIYRTLSYRFGRRNGRAPYTLAPEVIAPKPKIDPSTVADTEEDEADATDANSAGAAPADAGTGVRQVLMPAPQPTGAPVRPAAGPTPATKTAQPANSNQQRQSPTPTGDERPRRVPAIPPQ